MAPARGNYQQSGPDIGNHLQFAVKNCRLPGGGTAPGAVETFEHPVAVTSVRSAAWVMPSTASASAELHRFVACVSGSAPVQTSADEAAFFTVPLNDAVNGTIAAIVFRRKSVVGVVAVEDSGTAADLGELTGYVADMTVKVDAGL